MKSVAHAAAQLAVASCMPDLLKFTFKGMVPFEVERHYSVKITELAMGEYGWSYEYASRHVRIKLAIGSAQPNGPVTTLQVSYRIARLYAFFPPSIWSHLTEAEFKTYLEGEAASSYEEFLSDMESAPHGLVTHINRPTAKGNKGKGLNRRLKLGSTKSDYSADLYVRPGELPGLGAHVRGAAMDKARDEAKLVLGYAGVMSPGGIAQLYLDRAALKAWGYLFTKLDKGNLEMGEWVDKLHPLPNAKEYDDWRYTRLAPAAFVWTAADQESLFSYDETALASSQSDQDNGEQHLVGDEEIYPAGPDAVENADEWPGEGHDVPVKPRKGRKG